MAFEINWFKADVACRTDDMTGSLIDLFVIAQDLVRWLKLSKSIQCRYFRSPGQLALAWSEFWDAVLGKLEVTLRLQKFWLQRLTRLLAL